MTKAKVADISDATEFRIVRIQKPSHPEFEEDNAETPVEDVDEPLNLSVGQWVVVKYDDNEFPGKIDLCWQ